MSEVETFCVYCQKEYASPDNLNRHVLRQHPGTYRANAVTEELKSQYDVEAAQRRLRRESEARIWERTPLKRMRRTTAGALIEFVEVSEDELPAFVRARR